MGVGARVGFGWEPEWGVKKSGGRRIVHSILQTQLLRQT